jgi:hypothetical protein
MKIEFIEHMNCNMPGLTQEIWRFSESVDDTNYVLLSTMALYDRTNTTVFAVTKDRVYGYRVKYSKTLFEIDNSESSSNTIRCFLQKHNIMNTLHLEAA